MYRIGFDIGGSHIAGGLYAGGLEPVERISEPFPKGKPATVPEVLARMTRALCNGYTAPEALLSIGLAVPGSIDRAREKVISAHNLGFYDYPLRALAASHFPDVPVLLGNDADCAALAEYSFGALASTRCAVLLTLGTGLGGGVIIDGRLWRGGMGNGCELGHFIMDMSGEMCTCGVRGCCETRCSATGLIREARAEALKTPDSLINVLSHGDPANIDARLVMDCARQNDPAAVYVFDRYTDALSSACASIINILDPEAIALGGGVSGAGEFLFAPVREKTDKKSFYPEHARIVKARLGNDAGMLGAALLATQEF